MRIGLFGIALLFSGTLLLGPLVVGGKPPGGGPPAGDYPCLTSRFNLSPVIGPAGPIMTLFYAPSVLGTLHLDGEGRYRTASSVGRYTFDPSAQTFTFDSGGLEGWPVQYEVSDGEPVIRLATTKDGTVGPQRRTGESMCRCRGVKVPDASQAPEGRGG